MYNLTYAKCWLICTFTDIWASNLLIPYSDFTPTAFFCLIFQISVISAYSCLYSSAAALSSHLSSSLVSFFIKMYLNVLKIDVITILPFIFLSLSSLIYCKFFLDPIFLRDTCCEFCRNSGNVGKNCQSEAKYGEFRWSYDSYLLRPIMIHFRLWKRYFCTI